MRVDEPQATQQPQGRDERTNPTIATRTVPYMGRRTKSHHHRHSGLYGRKQMRSYHHRHSGLEGIVKTQMRARPNGQLTALEETIPTRETKYLPPKVLAPT